MAVQAWIYLQHKRKVYLLLYNTEACLCVSVHADVFVCVRARMCSGQVCVSDLAKLVNKTQGAVICFSNMQ